MACGVDAGRRACMHCVGAAAQREGARAGGGGGGWAANGLAPDSMEGSAAVGCR